MSKKAEQVLETMQVEEVIQMEITQIALVEFSIQEDIIELI